MEQAIYSGNLSEIKLLSRDLSQRQIYVYFVLAAAYGHSSIVEYFNEFGINIRIYNLAQEEAIRAGHLHISIHSMNVYMSKYLLYGDSLLN